MGATPPNTCALRGLAIHLENDWGARHGMGSDLAVENLVVGSARIRLRRRQGYGRQDFVFPEDVFAFGVDARQAEELGCWNRAFTRRADDPKRRLQGDQRWGRIRWIDDEARAAAKNGVKLIRRPG